MMAIVLLLALASGAFADEYTRVYWIRVVGGGGIEVQLGLMFLGAYPSGGGCISMSETTIDNVTYSVGTSKWQMRGEDSEWVDVEGTERNGGICGSLLPDMPGEFRWVVEIEIDGVQRKYASGNTLVIAGDPEAEDESAVEEAGDESAAEEAGDETAVEAVTWGFLKSRATR